MIFYFNNKIIDKGGYQLVLYTNKWHDAEIEALREGFKEYGPDFQKIKTEYLDKFEMNRTIRAIAIRLEMLGLIDSSTVKHVERRVESQRQAKRQKGKNSAKDIVFKRDNHECKVCGRKDNLEMHHVIEFKHTEKNDPNELITLCEICHMKITRGYCYSNHLSTYKKYVQVVKDILNIDLEIVKGMAFKNTYSIVKKRKDKIITFIIKPREFEVLRVLKENPELSLDDIQKHSTFINSRVSNPLIENLIRKSLVDYKRVPGKRANQPKTVFWCESISENIVEIYTDKYEKLHNLPMNEILPMVNMLKEDLEFDDDECYNYYKPRLV